MNVCINVRTYVCMNVVNVFQNKLHYAKASSNVTLSFLFTNLILYEWVILHYDMPQYTLLAGIMYVFDTTMQFM